MQPSEWEKILTKHIFDKNLTYKICKGPKIQYQKDQSFDFKSDSRI